MRPQPALAPDGAGHGGSTPAPAAACRVQLVATLIERSALRYTPGGVQAIEFRLRHASRQTEGGMERDIEWELDAVAIGEPAPALNEMPMGSVLDLKGFLAPRRKGGRVLRLHVTHCAPQTCG